ncbi:hypothetical protein LTR08_001692 [Meristemomyces frigidus]|nr:hypothetical protein LTR08_001692 [Meristemomyces frigidus]
MPIPTLAFVANPPPHLAHASTVLLSGHPQAGKEVRETVEGVALSAIYPATPKVHSIIHRPPPELEKEVTPLSRTLDPRATHLVSSPYVDFANQLDLRNLDISYRLLAYALTLLEFVRPDYATAPYMTSLDWPAVFARLRGLCAESDLPWERKELYVVIFRSQLKPNADRARLGQLDQESHREACQSGGLLKYWFGSCDAEQRNLATCIWRSREDAAAGGRGPWHRLARSAASEMYESITFHTHKLVLEAGAEQWQLEDDVQQ